MNVDGVDSHSESGEVMTNTPPDIADEANVYHKVEDLYFCEKKASKTFSLYIFCYFVLVAPLCNINIMNL
jgi:hypothetical protein